MLESRSLWDTDFFRLSDGDTLIVPAFRAWLSNSSSQLGRYLANIQYHAEFVEFSKTDVLKLERMIVKASSTKAAALHPLRLLGKVLFRLNQSLQLSIPQPTLAILLTPPVNPFAFSDLSLAHRSVQAWLEAEKIWLTDLRRDPAFKSVEGRNVPFELLLLSAALHGGILNTDLAVALHAAVLNPEKHVRYSIDRPYLDLSLAWQGKPDQEIRRWYPDEGVVCLIGRVVRFESSDGEGEESSNSYPDLRRAFCVRMHDQLTAQLRKRTVECELLPNSIPDLFAKIALFLRSEIPAVMVRYATRELGSRSLLTPSIDRVYGDPGLQPLGSAEPNTEESVETDNAEAYSGDKPDNLEPTWMEPIREGFRCSSGKELKDRFDRLDAESAVPRHIISFARRLIRHGSSSGNTLKSNSVKCCVLTVARRLGSLLEERDPATLPPEALEDLYVRAIDDAAKDSENPRRLQATVAWTMREFHRHLVRNRAAKPLNEADVFRIPRGFLTVDATMVSVEDVYATLDYLLYEPHPSWSDRNREIAKMQTLLGFFAGLRTMEGLGASRRDFPGGVHLPFLVLPSEERSLKTPNARRTIPISIFMEPFNDLAEQAGKWVQQISELNNDNRSSRLFGQASDDVIIPMIGEALRAATGNDRVRYYTLRHSFASWTLTRLFLSQFSDVPDLFPHLPLTTRWLQDSKQFRSRLYGNDSVDNDHAWAVATLMGHSSPSVSFASYCHTFDILLPQFLQQSRGLSSVLSARARLRLSSAHGRSSGYYKLPANRNASEDGVTDPVPDLSSANPGHDRHQFALDQLRNRYPALAATPVQLKPIRDRSWLEQTWGLLYVSTKPDCEIGKLAPYLGLDLEEATRIVERGRAICTLRSATANSNLHAVVTAEMQPGGSRVAAYPRRPDAKAMAIAIQLADRIPVVVRENRNTVCTVLDYYCRNVLPNSTSLVFASCEFQGLKTPDLVREYCRLLRSFGVHRRDLLFEGSDGTDRKFPRVDWYSQWGLRPRSSCKIVNWYGKRASRIALGEWLAISSRRARRDDKDYERPFFDAFRFVLLLAAVRFGRISEVQ